MRPVHSKLYRSRSTPRAGRAVAVLWAMGALLAVGSGEAISGEREDAAQAAAGKRAVARSFVAEQHSNSIRFQQESGGDLSFWTRVNRWLVGTKSDEGSDTDPYPKTGG
ncbi:MAG: hypothetical protein KDJ14_08145 [Xanthomonadales bacterium]|nr:hypothetical protein [Xanthomonadales bacterium]